MIQPTPQPCIKPCQRDAVDKSQFVAFLKMQNERLERQRDDAQEAIHEIGRHLMSGDWEAALGCVRDYQEG